MTRPLLCLIPALALALACDPVVEEDEMPMAMVGEEACEHFVDGPFEDVTAGDMMMNAGDISAEHSAKRVATVETDMDGNRGGFVTYDSAMAGPTTFFMSHHFDIMGMDPSETMVMPDKSVHDVEACDEVMMFHVFEFEADTTYTLEIGPTQEETVTIVWQHGDAADGDSGQHDHDDEEM
jgi:hypothetical protein